MGVDMGASIRRGPTTGVLTMRAAVASGRCLSGAAEAVV